MSASAAAKGLKTYKVRIGYDQEEKVYFVEKTDIHGLNVEAETKEEFKKIVFDLAPHLLGEPTASEQIIFS